MEDHAVVKALIYQGNKVIDGVRCNFGIELCLDDIAVFHFDGHNGIAHS